MDRQNNSYLHHIPNLITSVRLVIALIFPFCPEQWHLALIVTGLLTEFLDGFVARLFNWTSYIGQVLDPVADKLFMLSVSVTWILLGKLGVPEFFLLATRDFGVLLIFLLVLIMGRLSRTSSPKARLPSKITTALQYAAFLLILSGQLQWLMPLALLAAACGAVATAHYAYLVWHPDSPEKRAS